jgi:tetratricopeptide (TPR) repeat protein
MPDQGVITQNLREFTVQILKLPEGEIVGTGLAVSLDGRVATCAHVVVAAGVNPKKKKGRAVGVYFPQTRVNGERLRRAVVAAFFPEHDDDLVLLKLKEGPAPLAPEQLPVLGQAAASQGNRFRSYGYRSLEDYQSGWARGEIMGHVQAPPRRKLQEEPVQLDCKQINRGMSGSGVLDLERNLVIGVVSETWFPDRTGKDPYTAWAVDARVLSLKPLGLPLQDQDQPKREAPTPTMQPQAAAAAAQPGMALNNAPDAVPEWVGREDLLRGLGHDWLDPGRKVTGLIGFGGEGKSSLARRWLDELLRNQELPQPQGVFWWGFYEKRRVEEFLAAALSFFSGGRLDPRNYASTTAQAHLVAGMLASGRQLLVLDGLEVLQHQEGDRYGELTSQDLKEFLLFLAAPGQRSYTLITSRAPLMDLLNYTTYGEREVDRLSPAEGLALLRQLGVTGADENLAEIVADCDGHALTLSLLAGFLVKEYGGDIAKITEIPPPTTEEPRYDMVRRVLRHYDGVLTEPEREFLTIFSAFRLPVPQGALGPVFRGGEPGEPGLNPALARLGEQEFTGLLSHLRACRLLRFNEKSQEYDTHPLIRGHYQGRLAVLAEEKPQAVQTLHRRIKDYYLKQAGEPPEFPTLKELAPYLEAVHHACRAGDYDSAVEISWEKIYQRDRRVLIHQLGAYETDLVLHTEFFPEGDLSRDPLVSDRRLQGVYLNSIGWVLMNLGRLPEAAGFYQRSLAIKQEIKEWGGASITYRNLSELHLYLGELPLARQAAAEAFRLAQKAQEQWGYRISLAFEGWAAHLQGDEPSAAAAFTEAEALLRRSEPGKKFLYSLPGIYHADHLRRTGHPEKARQVTEVNLEICERNRWRDTLSQVHRLLGELAAEAGQDGEAREHFRRALELARSISHRTVLIEALAARGRWLARRGEAVAARRDLEEGLGYANSGGYRILEVDLRVGLAWANLQEGNHPAARQEADLAMSMSREMGYHWGKVDSQEVLAAL